MTAVARWIVLAFLGLAIAAGIALAASKVVSQPIGLSGQPFQAGNELAPPPSQPSEHHGSGNGGDGTSATTTTTTTPTPPTTSTGTGYTTTPVAPVGPVTTTPPQDGSSADGGHDD